MHFAANPLPCLQECQCTTIMLIFFNILGNSSHISFACHCLPFNSNSFRLSHSSYPPADVLFSFHFLSLQVPPPLMTSPSGLREGALQCPLVVAPTSHLSVKQQDMRQENDNSQSAGLREEGEEGEEMQRTTICSKLKTIKKIKIKNKKTEKQNTESSCLTCHNATMLR